MCSVRLIASAVNSGRTTTVHTWCRCILNWWNTCFTVYCLTRYSRCWGQTWLNVRAELEHFLHILRKQDSLRHATQIYLTDGDFRYHLFAKLPLDSTYFIPFRVGHESMMYAMEQMAIEACPTQANVKRRAGVYPFPEDPPGEAANPCMGASACDVRPCVCTKPLAYDSSLECFRGASSAGLE